MVVFALDRRPASGLATHGMRACRVKSAHQGHHANATPVTDGRYIVAFFGSQGLYAFDIRHSVWKKDLRC
jgi:hypothetical protein